MIDKAKAFLHWVGYPLRAIAGAFRVLVNLSRQQMRSLFSVAMIGGVIALSTQNVLYTYLARRAVDEGDTYRPLFLLIQEQMRFNSGLIARFDTHPFGARWAYGNVLSYVQGGASLLDGVSTGGTPVGWVPAAVGSRIVDPSGGAGTTFYVKESGTTSAGWVGK